MSKKKAQPVVMPKSDTRKTTIRIEVDSTKVATGHRPRRSGAGPHDNRPKRKRTRSAKKRAALKDWQ